MATLTRVRLILDPKERFPEKLYDVVCDNSLIKWNRSGTSVIVHDKTFEQHVMQFYPGFVQIPSFLNLRRLFREYAFDWYTDDMSTFEFSNPFFVKGQHGLLVEIKTRRKSFSHSFSAPSLNKPQRPLGRTSTPLGKTCSLRIRKARARHREILSESELSDLDVTFGCESMNELDTSSKFKHISNDDKSKLNSEVTIKSNNSLRDFDRNSFLSMYARNEFSEEEYTEFLMRKAVSHEKPIGPASETAYSGYEWMYLFPEVNASSSETSASISESVDSPWLGSCRLLTEEELYPHNGCDYLAVSIKGDVQEVKENEENFPVKVFSWSSSPTFCN